MKSKENSLRIATIMLCVIGLAGMDYSNLSILNIATIGLIAITLALVAINFFSERKK
jgi:hypothetical protein